MAVEHAKESYQPSPRKNPFQRSTINRALLSPGLLKHSDDAADRFDRGPIVAQTEHVIVVWRHRDLGDPFVLRVRLMHSAQAASQEAYARAGR